MVEKVKCEKGAARRYPSYHFNWQNDLIFEQKTVLPGHTNGIAFEGLDVDNNVLLRRVYYSIGGGFAIAEDELGDLSCNTKLEISKVPYSFDPAGKMLLMAENSGLSIAAMKRIDEETKMDRVAFNTALDMMDCINRGLSREGKLLGGSIFQDALESCTISF
ncbi:hypothetical protein H710_00678 [Bartonella bacilliformis Ver097]|uniref:L-serine ammonia-lyase n=1 Tax=Bartonella bacilliformis Ver097 TaxID=1293911 RepID=A0A072R2A6_BARBA|nr:hypothetical protein H710_00678 [Bartonella bacilliformis Ver097]